MARLMEVDGKVYLPAGIGMTSADTPVNATRSVNALMWALHEWRERFDGNLHMTPDAPRGAYWTPRVRVVSPGFEEWCGFETTGYFAPAGRLC